jgi:hypothetical protein
MSITYRRIRHETPGVNEVAQSTQDVVTQLNGVPILDGVLIEDVLLRPESGTPSSGSELLLHLDDDVVDSSGNSHTCTSTSLGTYATSGAGSTDGSAASGLGFDKTANFTGSSYIDFPDLGLGTGDFTIEWWARHNNPNLDMIHWGFDNVYFRTWQYGGNEVGGRIVDGSNNAWWLDVQSGVGTGDWYGYDVGTSVKAWRHFAVTRKDMGGGVSQWELYFSGRRCTVQNYSTYQPQDPAPPGLWAPTDITTAGRIGSAGPSFGGSFRGDIDEFSVFKHIKYSGSTYTIPTAPNVSGGGGGEVTVKTNRIRHRLGRKAKGAIVVKRSNAADVQVLSSNNASELSISTTANVTVSLWVF